MYVRIALWKLIAGDVFISVHHISNCLFVVCRWEKLRTDCENRKKRLERAQEQFEKVEDLFLQFAKRASSFQSWMEDAEEDLTDPVRCNSMEEVKVSVRWRRNLSTTHLLHHMLRGCGHCN